MAPATLLKNFHISSQLFPFVKLLLGKKIVVLKWFQEKLFFIYFLLQFLSRWSLAKEISVDFQNYCLVSWLYWHGGKHDSIWIEILHSSHWCKTAQKNTKILHQNFPKWKCSCQSNAILHRHKPLCPPLSHRRLDFNPICF